MSANQVIEELCLRYGLSELTSKSAQDKYSLVSRHNTFTFANRLTKRLLSAVCLYVSVFEDAKHVTITQICDTMAVAINEFGRVYNQVIKEFPHMKNEAIAIEELVEPTLDACHFDGQDRQQLVHRVIELIRVVRQCWLIEGRSPIHIIHGVAFLAWKSLKPWERNKVKLKDFCVTHRLEYKHTTAERVGEVFDVLKRLAQRIPGKASFRFTKQNIALYINTILEYESSLLFDLNNQFMAKTAASAESSVNWINTFKRKRTRNTQTAGQSTSSSGDHPNEEDFSDTEIDAYIRSASEVKVIKKLKKYCPVNDEKRVDVSHIAKYIEIDGLNLFND